MKLSEKILLLMHNINKSSLKKYLGKNYYKDVNISKHFNDYPLHRQYMQKVKSGIGCDILNKEIIEIGCGGGGISTFLAMNGAKKVYGIDINKEQIKVANIFIKEFREKNNAHICVEFIEMNATDLQFDDNSIDIIFADSAFEHFTDPEKVIKECNRVLRENGKLIVPCFSSWYSKNALHLKKGLAVPWANLFFSEQTIINVLQHLSKKEPILLDIYPGLSKSPKCVRDVRKYKDLNYITYRKFKKMSLNNGLHVDEFSYLMPRNLKIISSIIRKLRIFNKTILPDIFSTGARAVLIKK